MTNPVAEALARIRAWGEARDWIGYDPYDALLSPLARPLTLGSALGRRVLVQAVKTSPLNLRPALGIRPAPSAKAYALAASAYARLAAAQDDAAARAQARRWLGWLRAHHAGDGAGPAWGYPFDVQTRFFAYAAGTPNTIATSFAAQALLDGGELLGEEHWTELGRGAAHWLLARTLDARPGRPHFRYLPAEDALVHNANALACAALARAGRLAQDDELLEPAAAALATTLAAERPDGSWPYAEGGRGEWEDNFHTGYLLQSLAICDGVLGDLRAPLERGLEHWDRALFLPDGTPKYYAHRLWPVEGRCYAQAIETWVAVSGWHPAALGRAQRLAEQLVARMLDPAGYVHFQRRRWWTSRVPFVRWTTAPAFRALAGLELASARTGAPREEEPYARLD